MKLQGHHLIIFISVFLPVSFMITYFWSTGLGHVEKDFPYISDTGTYPPESCVFGLLLAIYAIATYLVVQGRWMSVHMYLEGSCDSKVNTVAFVAGVTSSVGTLVVACFQETNALPIHLLGAFMAFGVGGLYMFLQTFLSYRLPGIPGHVALLCHLRSLLCGAVVLSFLGTGGLGAMATGSFNNTRGPEPGEGIWTADMKGYSYHVGSAACEWAMAGVICLFFLSLASEFRHIRIGLPSVSMATMEDNFRSSVAAITSTSSGESGGGVDMRGRDNNGMSGEEEGVYRKSLTFQADRGTRGGFIA